MNHNAATILNLLDQRFANTALYKLRNAYIFKYDRESDFFIVQRSSGYCYEIEVKVSRADYLKDFGKKQKHEILSVGKYTKMRGVWDDTIRGFVDVVDGLKEHKMRPNKFYYCCPEYLINKSEVPEYAGLMYAREYDIYIAKEAPFIHKDMVNYHDVLCSKFYSRMIEERNANRALKNDYEWLKEKLESLTPKQ